MKTKKSLKWHLDQWQELEMSLIEDSEFCRDLGINRKTSFNYRNKGLIPYLRIHGRIYFKMSDVLIFLNSDYRIRNLKI